MQKLGKMMVVMWMVVEVRGERDGGGGGGSCGEDRGKGGD